jgi:hypothetical protein
MQGCANRRVAPTYTGPSGAFATVATFVAPADRNVIRQHREAQSLSGVATHLVGNFFPGRQVSVIGLFYPFYVLD